MAAARVETAIAARILGSSSRLACPPTPSDKGGEGCGQKQRDSIVEDHPAVFRVPSDPSTIDGELETGGDPENPA